MNFYISDLHLYDEGILKVTNRPFADTREMAFHIRDNWNEKVSTNDTVFILGDVAWVGLYDHPYRMKGCVEYLKSLKGRKILIEGNHDGHNLKVPEFRKRFIKVATRMEIKDGDTKLFLDHYPVEDWDGTHTGTIHLHGHVHNNPITKIENRYNVSVDVTGFSPLRLNEIIKKGPDDYGLDKLAIIPAHILPEGWKWYLCNDLVGTLKSPDNKAYVRYDVETGEIWWITPDGLFTQEELPKPLDGGLQRPLDVDAIRQGAEFFIRKYFPELIKEATE